MLGGLAVTGIFGYWLVQGEHSLSYSQTAGKVVALSLKANKSKGGRINSYTPKIRYSYVYNGATYSSDVISWGFDRVEKNEQAAFEQLFAQGHAITVFVDPSDPTNAVLEPGTAAMPAVIALGGTLAFGLSGAYLVNALLGFFGKPFGAKDIWGVIIFSYDTFTHVRGPIGTIYSRPRAIYITISIALTGGLAALVMTVPEAQRWWLLLINATLIESAGVAVVVLSAKARSSGRFDLIFDASRRTVSIPENAKPAEARSQMIETANIREFTMKAVEAKGKNGVSTNVFSAEYSAQVNAALDGGIRVLSVSGVHSVAPCAEILDELNAALVATTEGVTPPVPTF